MFTASYNVAFCTAGGWRPGREIEMLARIECLAAPPVAGHDLIKPGQPPLIRVHYSNPFRGHASLLRASSSAAAGWTGMAGRNIWSTANSTNPATISQPRIRIPYSSLPTSSGIRFTCPGKFLPLQTEGLRIAQPFVTLASRLLGPTVSAAAAASAGPRPGCDAAGDADHLRRLPERRPASLCRPGIGATICAVEVGSSPPSTRLIVIEFSPPRCEVLAFDAGWRSTGIALATAETRRRNIAPRVSAGTRGMVLAAKLSRCSFNSALRES